MGEKIEPARDGEKVCIQDGYFTREDARLVRAAGNELTAWAHDADTDEECRQMSRDGFALIGIADRIEALLPPESEEKV